MSGYLKEIIRIIESLDEPKAYEIFSALKSNLRRSARCHTPPHNLVLLVRQTLLKGVREGVLEENHGTYKVSATRKIIANKRAALSTNKNDVTKKPRTSHDGNSSEQHAASQNQKEDDMVPSTSRKFNSTKYKSRTRIKKNSSRRPTSNDRIVKSKSKIHTQRNDKDSSNCGNSRCLFCGSSRLQRLNFEPNDFYIK